MANSGHVSCLVAAAALVNAVRPSQDGETRRVLFGDRPMTYLAEEVCRGGVIVGFAFCDDRAEHVYPSPRPPKNRRVGEINPQVAQDGLAILLGHQ